MMSKHMLVICRHGESLYFCFTCTHTQKKPCRHASTFPGLSENRKRTFQTFCPFECVNIYSPMMKERCSIPFRESTINHSPLPAAHTTGYIEYKRRVDLLISLRNKSTIPCISFSIYQPETEATKCK